jgi:exodeoxyribonuclease VII large subunit
LARLWSSQAAPAVGFGVAEAHNAAPARLSWGVAALLLATGDALAARFGAVAVRGELSGFSKASSGHCYFNLKDTDGAPALLRCAMFKRAASLLNFAPADGQQVELRGRLTVYDARGELQLVVESLQRLGVGTLYEEFLRRRDRLQAQGYFDADRKRALPSFACQIGIVTSLGAAALHDVLASLQRRAPQVTVVLYPSLVQGADAPAALASALQFASQRHEVDVLLLVRGGGSLEDLWAFNDERVVLALVACPMPVVCGVGHETDISLCDLAADVRAATPTAAAELAVPARDDLLADLDAQALRLRRSAQRGLQTMAQSLDHLAQRIGQPARGVRGQADRLHDLGRRLQSAVRQKSARANDVLPHWQTRLTRAWVVQHQGQTLRVKALGAALQAHDPQRVLRRGYAWVQGQDGRPVVSVAQLRPGQQVRAVWADGQATAQIDTVEPATTEALPPTA